MKRKSILLFESSYNATNRQKFFGIHDFARKAGWRIQSIPYAQASKMQIGHGERIDVPLLLDIWHPDGCIIEGSGLSTAKRFRTFGKTPIVVLDATPNGAKPLVGTVIVGNQNEIAETAARELFKLPLSHFAYAAWPDRTSWDTERHRCFEKMVRATGRTCHFFRSASLGNDPKSLGDWLVNLPKPCGIFAANDFLGAQLIEEAVRRNLSVPGDLAVIGVDNEVSVCENASVPLSSIEQDCRGAGYRAAEALDCLMSGREVDPSRLVIGLGRIVRRQSTALLRRHDERVVRALEFIRRKATEGICVADVVSVMGCSSRQAHHLFAELCERSILEEIHGQRLESAENLLRHTSLSVAEVAVQCGYSSIQDFSRVFHRHVGTTPVKWRHA